MQKCHTIVANNNQTKLSSNPMKIMLQDTSNIARRDVPNLAACPRND